MNLGGGQFFVLPETEIFTNVRERVDVYALVGKSSFSEIFQSEILRSVKISSAIFVRDQEYVFFVMEQAMISLQ